MPSRSALAVVLADDQPLYRAGLAGALTRHSRFRIAAETGDGCVAVDLVRDLRPAIAILDLELPSLGGLGVLETLRQERLATRVLLLSASLGDQEVRRGLGLGAAGLLTKRADAHEVVDALERIAAGERVLDGRLGELDADDGRFSRDPTRPLTAREREVLALMAEGLSGPRIAERLVVSPSTVKSHIENLYDKLGVSQRGAAVAEGMRRGLLR